MVLGREGTVTREYFRDWRGVIGKDWDFAARQRRPPPDPVNAMLSFGYTLLVNEAIACGCRKRNWIGGAARFCRGLWHLPCLGAGAVQ